MVNGGVVSRLLVELLAAAQPAEPLLERLDPQRRTAVIMAIIWLVVVGLLLVTCTMLGARWVRRIARHKPRSPRIDPPARAAADNRSLHTSIDGVLPKLDPNETIHIDRKKGDTRIDP
jgi:hypothetical protein